MQLVESIVKRVACTLLRYVHVTLRVARPKTGHYCHRDGRKAHKRHKPDVRFLRRRKLN